MPYTNVSNVNDAPDKACPRCGSFALLACETATSIWRNGCPWVIERIPALCCASCDEVLIDGETAEKLNVIGRALPDGLGALRKIEVPVILFPKASHCVGRVPEEPVT